MTELVLLSSVKNCATCCASAEQKQCRPENKVTVVSGSCGGIVFLIPCILIFVLICRRVSWKFCNHGICLCDFLFACFICKVLATVFAVPVFDVAFLLFRRCLGFHMLQFFVVVSVNVTVLCLAYITCRFLHASSCVTRVTVTDNSSALCLHGIFFSYNFFSST